MGIEAECFVHPERISKELFCPICTLVLENPVQTPSEHLFCEDELLEWLTRSGPFVLTVYSSLLPPIVITDEHFPLLHHYQSHALLPKQGSIQTVYLLRGESY